MMGNPVHRDYDVFSKSKKDAITTAKEIFSFEEGQYENMQIGVKAVKVNRNKAMPVLEQLNSLRMRLEERFVDMNYADFLNFMREYEGFEVHLGSEPYFWFRVLGYTVKCRMTGGMVLLDLSEVRYEYNFGDVYIILNNEVYQGV